MPVFQRSIKTIQHADDGPGTLGAGQDTEALTWDNGTGKFVMSAVGGGGGNVAYTDAANVFTRKQTFGPSVADLTLGDEMLTDVTFPDLTNWNDDSSGWNVVSGGITHTPGPNGTLGQSVNLPRNSVYLVEIRISGMTAGFVDIYGSTLPSIEVTENGTYNNANYVEAGSDTFTIYASEDFDGKIEYVSLKESVDGSYPIGFPGHIVLNVQDAPVCLIRSTDSGGFIAGYGAGRFARTSVVAIGDFALDSMVDEEGLIAIGPNAGIRAVGLTNTVLIGAGAGDTMTGNSNLIIGPAAGSGSNLLNVTAIGTGAASSITVNGGIYIGTYAGDGQNIDNRLWIGSGGSIVSGLMNGGDAATQTLKFHAATINMADLPTSSAGLNAGDLWNNSGVLNVA